MDEGSYGRSPSRLKSPQSSKPASPVRSPMSTPEALRLIRPCSVKLDSIPTGQERAKSPLYHQALNLSRDLSRNSTHYSTKKATGSPVAKALTMSSGPGQRYGQVLTPGGQSYNQSAAPQYSASPSECRTSTAGAGSIPPAMSHQVYRSPTAHVATSGKTAPPGVKVGTTAKGSPAGSQVYSSPGAKMRNVGKVTPSSSLASYSPTGARVGRPPLGKTHPPGSYHQYTQKSGLPGKVAPSGVARRKASVPQKTSAIGALQMGLMGCRAGKTGSQMSSPKYATSGSSSSSSGTGHKDAWSASGRPQPTGQVSSQYVQRKPMGGQYQPSALQKFVSSKSSQQARPSGQQPQQQRSESGSVGRFVAGQRKGSMIGGATTSKRPQPADVPLSAAMLGKSSLGQIIQSQLLSSERSASKPSKPASSASPVGPVPVGMPILNLSNLPKPGLQFDAMFPSETPVPPSRSGAADSPIVIDLISSSDEMSTGKESEDEN